MLNYDELPNFTGTESWHKFNWLFQRVVLTDGAKYVADTAGAYWLMELIASYQRRLQNEPFQVWKLEVAKGKALVICEDGNDNILIRQRIEFTTFPEPGITLWVEHGEYIVILLPSEH